MFDRIEVAACRSTHRFSRVVALSFTIRNSPYRRSLHTRPPAAKMMDGRIR